MDTKYATLPQGFTLYGQQVTLFIKDAPANSLPHAWGYARFSPYEIEIYTASIRPLKTFFHELVHVGMNIIGMTGLSRIDDETFAELCAAVMWDFFQGNDPVLIQAVFNMLDARLFREEKGAADAGL